MLRYLTVYEKGEGVKEIHMLSIQSALLSSAPQT